MEATAAVRQEQHELASQLQFPPGYHFVPTEQELVNVYLRGKIEHRKLPLHVVNDVSVLDWQPGSLIETYKAYGEHKWYFFTVREPSSSNKEDEPNRKVRVSGVKATWKATGSVVAITAEGNKQEEDGEEPAAGEKVVVGTKRVLIYHSSDPEEDGKWSMHEYILNGHGKIGQYALCSIQRKQHSDTVDNAGEGGSSSRKRTKATNNPGKTKKRRTNKAASTQPEGVQLQQQEAAPVEAPLKPKSRTRRTATKRKNKASVQEEGKQQKQKHQEIAPVSPAVPPLTPPQQARPQASQQEQKSLAASAPVLPAATMQGYPSLPDGMLGASAPMHEEDTRALSFEWGDVSWCLEDLVRPYKQEEQLPSFTGNEVITDSHAQHQHLYQQQGDCNLPGVHSQLLYPGQQYLPGNITQSNGSWMHGQDQNYQQEIGGAFGAQDQHTTALYYDQPYEHEMHSPLLGEADYCSSDQFTESVLGQADYCSSDQFTESVQGDTVASGSDGDIGLTAADFFAMSMLRDDDPQDCVGTQDGSSPEPEALQSQDEPPPRSIISEFW